MTAEAEVLKDPLVRTAVDAIRAADHVCRLVHRRQADVRTLTKEDRSPVTVADYASQAVVARWLAERAGVCSIVAEEDAAFLAAPGREAYLDVVLEVVRPVWGGVTRRTLLDALDSGQRAPTTTAFWTLDPIDGTRGFLRGQHYAISLAYVERGRPRIGVLACPRLSLDRTASPVTPGEGVRFVAVEGYGAFEVTSHGIDDYGERVSCRAEATRAPLRVCASVEASHSDAGLTAAILASVGRASNVLRLDSQAKYAVVARGQADAYLRVPTSSDYSELIWDHAAGALIASEAGARVSDLCGRDLDFGRGQRLSGNCGVLCAGSAVHGAILATLCRTGLLDVPGTHPCSFPTRAATPGGVKRPTVTTGW